MFIVLSSSTVNASNHTKCVLLSNQKCMIQLTLINLNPNEYSQESHYYPFSVKLDRCDGGCNTLDNLYNKVCVPNKCRCECKKCHVCEKIMLEILQHVIVKLENI